MLVLGNKGQLGREFCDRFTSLRYDFRGYDIDDLNIADSEQVDSVINCFHPHFIINCAAYNLVDKAETDYESAYNSNALGVMNIARSAQKIGAFVVHYSSDYVFDGLKNEPYIESDDAKPINKYGLSKLEGEKLLAENANDFLIFRLSWVYGKGSQNFIHKLLDWAEKQNELKIADDEISVPTSVKTIADVTLSAIDNELSGVYHLTNSGSASRLDWASEILTLAGRPNKIIPVSRLDFFLPAKRPGYSVMDNTKVSQELNTAIPHWKDSLSVFLKKR
jgi:dTDP-4-dehydrorhamnose reductase